MKSSLAHLRIGDKIALPTNGNTWGDKIPQITHTIHAITARTATQLTAGSFKIRIADGKIIGKNYIYAIEATPELLTKNEAQNEAVRRWNSARIGLHGLIGKELHQLHLSTEQMEHLGKAWAEVQAMGAGVKP